MKNNTHHGYRKSKQNGFGLLGLLGGAFLATFFSVVAVSLLPPYLENFSVRSCLSSLAEDTSILKKNEESIKAALLNKLSVSNVSHVSKNDISVVKDRTGIKINVAYNVQARFMSNVDFVVHFDEMEEVSL